MREGELFILLHKLLLSRCALGSGMELKLAIRRPPRMTPLYGSCCHHDNNINLYR